MLCSWKERVERESEIDRYTEERETHTEKKIEGQREREREKGRETHR